MLTAVKQTNSSTPPTTAARRRFGARLCSLIASHNYGHKRSPRLPISETAKGVNRGASCSSLKFRLCLQMDSVCMNKRRPWVCILGGEGAFSAPFRCPQQHKISLTSERLASYYHHYRHQHDTGRKRIMCLLFCCAAVCHLGRGASILLLMPLVSAPD